MYVGIEDPAQNKPTGKDIRESGSVPTHKSNAEYNADDRNDPQREKVVNLGDWRDDESRYINEINVDGP